VTNANTTALTAQKAAISQTLTSQVQAASPSNSKSQVNVNAVTDLGNGTLQMQYTCSDVSDHTSAQTSLNTACQGDAVKQTVAKCSQSDDTGSKTTQKVAAATATTAKKEGATTQKVEALASTTIKKVGETATTGKHMASIDFATDELLI
jgi:hypothetical protein